MALWLVRRLATLERCVAVHVDTALFLVTLPVVIIVVVRLAIGAVGGTTVLAVVLLVAPTGSSWIAGMHRSSPGVDYGPRAHRDSPKSWS